ncbi:related to Hsp70/Hsp90 co-chaperone CNS1 [Hanseniaspora guilliermondii]|uniref:Related to Hsp70/Hsp90 co-chaperone CNS1 n=1 Tax=Hanseniaspora guilliermondii TaxID=56406 RepID=A0A1L0AYH6_9ASCO|nr:related to Hsp70/Hsp90 co-chaperone CNS1 [Hanseniaspora guilliermondii]
MSDKPKLERYVPKPGEPALPPQLSEFQNKSTSEVLEELNKMPFFMNSLPSDMEADESFQALEALRAMNYEGNPTDMITNFKNQGNEMFKAKNYKDARAFYQRGLDIDAQNYNPDEDTVEADENNKPFDINEFNLIKAVVYSNKAACELSLKNYRRCINDCKKSLSIDSKNIKAYFRMAKAFMMLKLFDESLESIQFGLLLDKDNKSLLNLLNTVNDNIIEIDKNNKKNESIRLEEDRQKNLLEAAIDLRQYTNVNKAQCLPLPNKTYLEQKDVVDSQMIFSACVMYPGYNSYDPVGDISELSTPQELLSLFLDIPQEVADKEPKYSIIDKQTNGKNVHIYMETLDGGLIKLNKKLTFNQILQNQSPKIPLFNKQLHVYFAAKDNSQWIKDWDKEMALAQRV